MNTEALDTLKTQLTRFQHRTLASGYPINTQQQAKIFRDALADLQQYVDSECLKARLDEHHKMIAMIKATDMQTQYQEYWSAGNLRLAKLQAELNTGGIKE